MKKKRQEMILSLIGERDIDTQDGLCEALKQAGFDVTQATVSRDIKELKISKVALENGGQRYVSGIQGKKPDDERNVTILREAAASLEVAGNLLVIKTLSGMAMAVAAAVDGMNLPEIVGCIAGDDTIMCAIKTAGEAEIVRNRLLRIIEGQG
ncbi:MAG: arginine repressor [Lachnospiraceae bacterium]|nr:arginine repressor [Lachnospiraceae bacterium]